MHGRSITYSAVTALPLLVAMAINSAFAHCEIPCGIYDDELRLDMIAEHIMTVEKSMSMIAELQKDEQTNHNQMVRWVNNKESHASEIQYIVSQYFMTQRVKRVGEEDDVTYKAYVRQITLLHEMLIIAMKMKQTTDPTTVEKFRSLLEEFRAIYLSGRK